MATHDEIIDALMAVIEKYGTVGAACAQAVVDAENAQGLLMITMAGASDEVAGAMLALANGLTGQLQASIRGAGLMITAIGAYIDRLNGDADRYYD